MQKNYFMKNYVFKILLLLLLTTKSFSQETASRPSTPQKAALPTVETTKLEYKAHGALNYYQYKWDIDKDRRSKIDLERLNLYLKYNLSPKIEIKSEIEFEHGGAGATMAFDPLEEFGEYEIEIEKGGEVQLSQLNVLLKYNQYLNFKVGRFSFINGNASVFDSPTAYSTTYVSDAENDILPIGWYETGLEISGHFKIKEHQEFPKLAYKLYAMTGLDNSGFNSLNWIKKGHQTRFEMVNAENFAYSLRTDFYFSQKNMIGINLYTGNTTGNRQKNDFTAPSQLIFGDFHLNFEQYPFKIRGYSFYGFLQNSEALSTANRNVSNQLNVKRTPVGQTALASYFDFGYDVFHLFGKKIESQLYGFFRYDFVDSMHSTQGLVYDNPKYERHSRTIGLNYFPDQNIVFKTQFAFKKTANNLNENTFSIGLGFNI